MTVNNTPTVRDSTPIVVTGSSPAPADTRVSEVSIAQAQAGTDSRLAQAGAPAVNERAVASLRALVEQPRTVPRGEYVQQLTQKLEALGPAERNLFLKTLSTDGTRTLTIELGRMRGDNPSAYQANVHNLTAGQPPQQIQRLIDAAARFENEANPAARQVAHDIAAEVAANGTKGQKLGLIDLMSDPSRGGGATQSATKAEAVGELFKGQKGDPTAVTSALALMSQSDKAAVARETLRSDDAAGIAQVLRYTALATDVAQRTQMAEQFVTQAHLVQGDKREAVANGATAALREQINSAGRQSGVSPAAIAAILHQELVTRGGSDVVQDRYAVEIANTAVGSPERQAAIARANQDGNISPNPLSRKNIARETTLGYSQLSVEGVVKLFGGQWNAARGRFEMTAATTYVPGSVMSQQQFFADPVGNAMKLLTNPELAPTLVGAWSARVIDIRRGNTANEDIGLIPRDTAATAQQRQARESLQFRYLTGSYSTGGNIESVGGQPLGSAGGLGSPDTERTRNPSRFAPGQLAPGEQAALDRRERIEQLLQGRF